jgi:hypothetical protein
MSLLLAFQAAPLQAASVSLFDTGAASTAPLSGQSIAQQVGWAKLPEDQTNHRFQGDAAFLNDRLAVVLRREGPGAEVYARGANGWTQRAVLAPAVEEAKVEEPPRLASLAIVENAPGGVTLEASFRSAGGRPLGLRYELGMGQVFVKTEPRGDTAALRVAAPCRFAVLPDFFADDMVIDAAEIPVAAAELPSENFLLHMIPGGQSVVLSVSNSRERDARVALSGQGGSRVIDQSEVYFGKQGAIWVAVLEGEGIWHEQAVTPKDAGQIIPLSWHMPYPAQWRVDWRRTDKLSSSWEMIVENRRGEFDKYGWFGNPTTIPQDRSRWATVLGKFPYPCWIDRGGQGFFQPLKREVLRFDGPALIYPVNRVAATPLEQFTVVDMMRATLGVGPCEYILDVEGQAQSHKGRATCPTRDALGAIYGNGQQKQKRAEIERILDEVVIFVKHIRGRIETYVAFGHELLAYLEEQKKAHPELADFLAEMETLSRTIDARFEKRQEKIKTPQYVVDLTEKFRATLLDYEGDDALAKCKAITEAIVVVGGNQDELVGECRMAVRILRQRAGLSLATNPRAAEIAREIRSRTQAVLRNPASYEGARQ